jgi:6-phosphogluconolactonase
MIKIFSNKDELALFFCDELVKFVLEKKEIFLSLSGGSTPEIIYKYLSADYNDKIDWRKVHLFWGDERCVPPDSEQSNYGMIKKYLLNFIDIPEKNVHPVDGGNDPEKEAKRYSEVIKKIVPFKNEFPVFDLVMLGLGDDGHTASIFPDQMWILNSKEICEVTVHPSTRQKRITLSGTVINNAGRVIFLVTGKSKAEIVKKVLEKNTKKYPAEFIHPENGELQFYLDYNAAAQLSKKQSHVE